jgi:3-hydroxyacyl-[acyl-carrier-protein] dehydratase
VTKSEAWICIPKDHPALPGHFPGAPVVPAVVMLDYLVRAAEREWGRALPLMGMPQVKFVSPLLPEQRALCALQMEGPRLIFSIEHSGRVIARGAFALVEESTGQADEGTG